MGDLGRYHGAVSAARDAGLPVKVRTPADAIANRIALVPEDRKRHGIFASLSVWENVVISALRHFSRNGVLDLRRASRRGN